MPYLRTAARHGSVAAAGELGSSYRKGEGVEPDFQQAFQWYRHGATVGERARGRGRGGREREGEGEERDGKEGREGGREGGGGG